MVDVGNDVLAGSDQTGRSGRRSRQQWLTLATMCWIRLVEVAAGQDSSGVEVRNDVLDQTGRSDRRSRQQWLTLATMCWQDQIRLVEVTTGPDSSG